MSIVSAPVCKHDCVSLDLVVFIVPAYLISLKEQLYLVLIWCQAHCPLAADFWLIKVNSCGTL